MDLVNYQQSVFDAIVKEYKEFANQIGIDSFTPIAVSALTGDNIIKSSPNMLWYTGPTLLSFLETVELPEIRDHSGFSMPVQWVNRPNLDFRGFSGQVSSGRVAKGDAVQILPSKQISRVARIVTYDGDLDLAIRGQSITLTLEDEIDISRGDVIVAEDASISSAHQFKTTVLWMSEESMNAGAQYWIKIRAKIVSGTFSSPDYQLDVNTLDRQPTQTLQ